MVITYLGEGSFRLQSGEISVLVDPPSNRLKGDVVLWTAMDSTFPKIPRAKVEFSHPGEYESRGIEIQGIPIGANRRANTTHTVYLMRWEGITFAFLGTLAHVPDSELLQALNDPDVLFLRLGHQYLSDEIAEKLVRQIEPKVVIPAYEKSPQSFLKEMGEGGSLEEKFVFRKKDLETIEGTKTIALVTT